METDTEYRERIWAPLEALASTISVDYAMKDDEVIERATAQIKVLRKMVLVAGMDENLLNTILENVRG